MGSRGRTKSYGANLKERRRDLEVLMAKHSLKGIALKDHLQLALMVS